MVKACATLGTLAALVESTERAYAPIFHVKLTIGSPEFRAIGTV